MKQKTEKYHGLIFWLNLKDIFIIPTIQIEKDDYNEQDWGVTDYNICLYIFCFCIKYHLIIDKYNFYDKPDMKFKVYFRRK